MIHKQMHPKIAEEFSQVNSEIKGHLTEKQATQFEALMKNRRNQGPGGPRRGFGNGPGRGEGHRDSSKGGIFRQNEGIQTRTKIGNEKMLLQGILQNLVMHNQALRLPHPRKHPRLITEGHHKWLLQFQSPPEPKTSSYCNKLS